ncbi:MAG: WG repeat-containing protein [Bacteroidales bacterium]|nr:WG repeat-containing protein [Bacteroidales bacterium]
MEKTEKDAKEFNAKDEEVLNEATNETAAEKEQKLADDGKSSESDGMPSGKKCRKRWFPIVLLVIAAVAAGVLVFRSCQSKEHTQTFYDYYYGDEPSGGHISYKNGKSNIVNPATKEVIVEDIDWSHYSDNSDENPLVLFAKNGKRGFCNIMTNEVIVKPESYTKAWVFSEGLAAVERKGYIGFVDTSGKVAIDFRFSYRGNSLYEFVFHNGYCVVADSANRIGVIDKKGRWVVKPLYDDVDLAKDYAIVYKEGDFKKQVDFNGNVVQEGIIDNISELYYEVRYNDLVSGEPKVGQAKNNNFYAYNVGGYSGLIDSKGKVVTPPIYTDISGITATLFKARLQDWSSIVIIDTKGNVVSNR